MLKEFRFAFRQDPDLKKTLRDVREDNEAKKIRDRAYTHLKEVEDEIRAYGQFVFWENKRRLLEYRSQPLRETKMKRIRKLKTNEAVKNDAPGN